MPVTHPFFRHAVIVGVGLLGGSIARELLHHNLSETVVGFGRSQENLLYAQKNGIISHIGHDLLSALAIADLVVLAMPVGSFAGFLQKYSGLIRSQTLVIDVGSTKKLIAKLSDKYFPEGNFVPCHPMAGSEKSGAGASQLNLFEGKTCLLTPGTKTKTKFVTLAHKFWKALGAKTQMLKPAQHDQILAFTSHLPQVMASVLMSAVAKNVPHRKLANLVGNGFRDTTRLAASDAAMWTDIVLDNRENLRKATKRLQDELAIFGKALSKADARALQAYFKQASDLKKTL